MHAGRGLAHVFQRLQADHPLWASVIGLEPASSALQGCRKATKFLSGSLPLLRHVLDLVVQPLDPVLVSAKDRLQLQHLARGQRQGPRPARPDSPLSESR